MIFIRQVPSLAQEPGGARDKSSPTTAAEQKRTVYVTAVYSKQHLVADLKAADFVVYENEQPQRIDSVRFEDVPASIGILVDNSDSMRDKRNAITKAMLNFIKNTRSDDEFFVVNFNDEASLDQDFTTNLSLLNEALDRPDARGGTALFDAVIASAAHLMNTSPSSWRGITKIAKHEKKALLIVTDSEDNESAESVEQAMRAIQERNGPIVYTIGILGSEAGAHRAKRDLEVLALNSGGLAFFPRTLDETDSILQAVARDIKNQYTISYLANTRAGDGSFRHVKVFTPKRDTSVRCRCDYFSSPEKP